MAFTTEGTMQLIYKAMTTKWPEGKASDIIKQLLKKYKPQDTITQVELTQKLNKITMKRNANPATLFERLSTIENQYNMPGKKIEEADLIAVVLDAAPAEYQSVLTAEQQRRGPDLSVADLEDAMNQRWRQTQIPRTGGKDKNDNNEVSLAAGDLVEHATVVRRKVIGAINSLKKRAVMQKMLKARKITSTIQEAFKENVTTVSQLWERRTQGSAKIVGSRKKIKTKDQKDLSCKVNKAMQGWTVT
jgi:gag-polypeptide of LTR copia-type